MNEHINNLASQKYLVSHVPHALKPRNNRLRGFHPRKLARLCLEKIIYSMFCTREKISSFPPEFLLPQIRKEICLQEFGFITAHRVNPIWSKQQLEQNIMRLGPWEYYLPFSYGLSTAINASFDAQSVDFHRYRSKLICESVADLFGDQLSKSTVLDLGAHCGIMAMDIAFRGAAHVDGFELRKINLERADFLKEYFRIQNVSFTQADVCAIKPDRKWDVVLCLGLLYHVDNPMDLIKYCYASCDKLVVIDTICHTEPIPAYILVRNRNKDVHIEGKYSHEFHPTYRAVIDSMQEAGFKDIVELIGETAVPIDLYGDFTRRCFIGFK